MPEKANGINANRYNFMQIHKNPKPKAAVKKGSRS